MNLSREELDVMWMRAMHECVRRDEPYTRYRFAEMVAALAAAAEREACAAFLENNVDLSGLAPDLELQAFTGKLLRECAKVIRARGDA